MTLLFNRTGFPARKKRIRSLWPANRLYILLKCYARWNFLILLSVSEMLTSHLIVLNLKRLRVRKPLLLTLFAIAFYCFSQKYLPAVERKPVASASILLVNEQAGESNARKLTRTNFEDVLKSLYNDIGLPSYGLSYEVFRLGMIGFYSLEKEGALNSKGLITIIDFAQPSTEKRLFTIDVISQEVIYHTYVAHGRNTGENMAKRFSNRPHSNQSSLGFYVTGETYVGSKGYSLRLDGKEKTFNDKIRSRAVVMHAADYATEAWIKRYGRLGRSQGCPALPPHLSKKVIDTIKDRTVIFTYYPDEEYLNTSRYLNVEDLFEQLDKDPIEFKESSAISRS